jgi:transposase
MLIRDRLDVLFEDEEFAGLYPSDGRPGLSPGHLALVSVLQFAENLSDQAAADAVRTRIEWKYAIGLGWRIRDSTTRSCASSGPGRPDRTVPPTGCCRCCWSG